MLVDRLQLAAMSAKKYNSIHINMLKDHPHKDTEFGTAPALLMMQASKYVCTQAITNQTEIPVDYWSLKQ